MSNIRFVAFDIDGTLVNDKKEFPLDLHETVAYLLEQNINIMIGSGRSLKALLRDFKDYKDDFYFAAENGAVVYYKSNVTINSYLDRKLAFDIMHHLDKLKLNDVQLNYVVSCENHAFVLESSEQEFKDTLNPYYQIDLIDDFNNIDEKIIKIAAYAPYDSKNRIEQKSFMFNDYCDVCYSGDQWCDFNPKGISKGTAVENTLKSLGLTKDNAAAFGDADNDISMLQAVTHSVAMINGNDNIKKVAKYITEEDNNSNGAIKYLLKLLHQ